MVVLYLLLTYHGQNRKLQLLFEFLRVVDSALTSCFGNILGRSNRNIKNFLTWAQRG